MPKIVVFPRHAVLMFAVLAGFTILTAPVERAFSGAAPVTVTNPPTSPAITSSVDDPGRIPYQFLSTQNNCEGLCLVEVPSIPSGKRLVIQHVSVRGDPIQIPLLGRMVVSVFVSAGPGLSGLVGVSSFIPTIFDDTLAADQAMQLYADEVHHVTVEVQVAANGSFGLFVTVSGYLLDCKVNKCAPIAP